MKCILDSNNLVGIYATWNSSKIVIIPFGVVIIPFMICSEYVIMNVDNENIDIVPNFK